MFFFRKKYPFKKEKIYVLFIFEKFDKNIYESILKVAVGLNIKLCFQGIDLDEEYSGKLPNFQESSPLHFSDSQFPNESDLDILIVRNEGALIHVHFTVRFSQFKYLPFNAVVENSHFIISFYCLQRFKIVQTHNSLDYYRRYGYSTKGLKIIKSSVSQFIDQESMIADTIKFLDVDFVLSAFKIQYPKRLINTPLNEFYNAHYKELIRELNGINELIINKDPLKSHEKRYMKIRIYLRERLINWKEKHGHFILDQNT